MHGIEEFIITQGNTIDEPKILENDEIQKFDVIMSNPEFSFSKWNQSKFTKDPFGRNILGTPPQSIGDYAFQQHILQSLKKYGGRSVTVFPHGVLFRDSEASMRKKMVEENYLDAVIGLGKNLFFGSTMESCLLVCSNKNKPINRIGKIIFIDGKDEIKLERSDAYLKDTHIKKISDAYWDYIDIEGFAKVVETTEILEQNDGNLSIQLYVK